MNPKSGNAELRYLGRNFSRGGCEHSFSSSVASRLRGKKGEMKIGGQCWQESYPAPLLDEKLSNWDYKGAAPASQKRKNSVISINLPCVTWKCRVEGKKGGRGETDHHEPPVVASWENTEDRPRKTERGRLHGNFQKTRTVGSKGGPTALRYWGDIKKKPPFTGGEAVVSVNPRPESIFVGKIRRNNKEYEEDR